MKVPFFLQIIIALFLGVAFALLFPGQVDYIAWVGGQFMRLLKMLIVPLVLTSIVLGVANLNGGKGLGVLGVKTLFYYLTTSLFAILTGLFFVNMIKPGDGMNLILPESTDNIEKSASDVLEQLQKIIPTNIFASLAEGNLLSVIFVAIVMGIFILKLESKHKDILTVFFEAFNELIIKIVDFVIILTPFAVFALVASAIFKAPSFNELIISLGWYMLTVMAALFFHAFITLFILLRTIGKVSPFEFLKHMSTALITAFSTSSSNATLPVTLECITVNAKVPKKITGFTIPLGATINMDGTALYECIAVIFIAQAYGIDLSFAQQFIIVASSLLLSIGAAGIPMAGFFMLSVILTYVGLPVECVGIVLSVDRILDMFRTAVNVWSDSCGARILAQFDHQG